MNDTKIVQVCMDVETTGLMPGHHEIVELALVPRVPRFEPLVLRIKADFPDRADPEALKIHGLDITEGNNRKFAYGAIKDYVYKLCRDTPFNKVRLIGQQIASFDVQFCKMTWGVKTWDRLASYRHRDTAAVALALIDAGIITPATPSMRDLLDYFGIARPMPDHRALPDAQAELMLWEELDAILKQHPRAQLS
jgi:DNA polymerase III epsilon subunit-like protein